MIEAGIIKKGKLISDVEWRGYLDSLKFSGDKNLLKTRDTVAHWPLAKLKEVIVGAVEKRAPMSRFGILFSGGVDSSLIALICKKLGCDFICYAVGIKGSKDLEFAEKCANEMGFELCKVVLEFNDVERLIKKVNKILGPDIERPVVHVGVGVVEWAAYEAGKKDKINCFFNGLGSEEIFAGYERHSIGKWQVAGGKWKDDVNKECLAGLRRMIYGDFLRDFLIAKKFNVIGLSPFLDKSVIECGMGISGKEKLKKGFKKFCLREVAFSLGLADEFAWRKKKAAQYGSGVDKVLGKLAKEKKVFKGEYLKLLLK